MDKLVATTDPKGANKGARWVMAIAAALTLGLAPSITCACLEAQRASPVRMLLAVLCSLVIATAWASPVGTRAMWAVVASLLALISIAGALALGSISLIAAVGVLLAPSTCLVLHVARRRLKRSTEGENAV